MRNIKNNFFFLCVEKEALLCKLFYALKLTGTKNVLSQSHYMSKCGEKLSDKLYILVMSHEKEKHNNTVFEKFHLTVLIFKSTVPLTSIDIFTMETTRLCLQQLHLYFKLNFQPYLPPWQWPLVTGEMRSGFHFISNDKYRWAVSHFCVISLIWHCKFL